MKECSERQTCSRVVVVSPVRDEADHLSRLAESMIAQTLQPFRWVIVNDGSRDRTGELADELARQHRWISVVHRPDRGRRQLGGGVIEAFDAGLRSVSEPWEFIGKVDADVSFSPRYIEELLKRFESDPSLGAASGKVFRPEGDRLVEEFMIDDMVAGQWKLHRRSCFLAIGGFVREVMWDGIDIHRARQEGYTTRSFADRDLRILHHRLMGSSDRNVWVGRLRWGRGQWFLGSHPLYLLASAIFRMMERPYIVGGVLIAAGYVGSALRRRPRFEHPGFRQELRRWQWGRLARLLTIGRLR